MHYTHPIGTRWLTVKTDAFNAGVTLIQEDGYVQIIGERGRIGRLERHPSFDTERMVLPTWTRVGLASAAKHNIVQMIQEDDNVTMRETSRYWNEDNDCNPSNIMGVVTEIDGDQIEVEWENGYENTYEVEDLRVCVTAKNCGPKNKRTRGILERFHEACKMIGESTNDTHCHYTVFSSDSAVKTTTIDGACHASLKYNRTPDKLFVITRIDKARMNAKSCSQEEAIFYYDWLFNRSPLRHAFLTKNARRAVKLGYAVTRARVGANYMQVANVAVRQPWENHNKNVVMFRKYVAESGLPENAAWVLAEYANTSQQALRPHLGGGGHRMFNFHTYGPVATRRFIQDDLLPATEPYRTNSDYSGTDRLIHDRAEDSENINWDFLPEPTALKDDEVEDVYVNIFAAAIKKDPNKKVYAFSVADRVRWAEEHRTTICDYLIGEEV